MANPEPDTNQMFLFKEHNKEYLLPADFAPVRPDYFHVFSIFLAKGSISTLKRRKSVERICSLYPEVEVKEHLNTPHNRIQLNETEALARHKTGKQTLVFRELKSALRFSEETAIAFHLFTSSLRLCEG